MSGHAARLKGRCGVFCQGELVATGGMSASGLSMVTQFPTNITTFAPCKLRVLLQDREEYEDSSRGGAYNPMGVADMFGNRGCYLVHFQCIMVCCS